MSLFGQVYEIKHLQKDEGYNPPSNPEHFYRWYEQRQLSINVPDKFVKHIIGKDNSSKHNLEAQFNIHISLINHYKFNTTEFLITDQNWLPLIHKNNMVHKCRQTIESRIISYEEKSRSKYGCKTCMIQERKFKTFCLICKKQKGCISCKNRNECYNNLCEECGRNNCCPTCLRIDGTVMEKCIECNR